MPLRVHGVPGCADWPASPNRRSELGDRTPNDATERRRRVRHHERRTALRHSVVVVGKRVERAHRVPDRRRRASVLRQSRFVRGH